MLPNIDQTWATRANPTRSTSEEDPDTPGVIAAIPDVRAITKQLDTFQIEQAEDLKARETWTEERHRRLVGEGRLEPWRAKVTNQPTKTVADLGPAQDYHKHPTYQRSHSSRQLPCLQCATSGQGCTLEYYGRGTEFRCRRCLTNGCIICVKQGASADGVTEWEWWRPGAWHVLEAHNPAVPADELRYVVKDIFAARQQTVNGEGRHAWERDNMCAPRWNLNHPTEQEEATAAKETVAECIRDQERAEDLAFRKAQRKAKKAEYKQHVNEANWVAEKKRRADEAALKERQDQRMCEIANGFIDPDEEETQPEDAAESKVEIRKGPAFDSGFDPDYDSELDSEPDDDEDPEEGWRKLERAEREADENDAKLALLYPEQWRELARAAALVQKQAQDAARRQAEREVAREIKEAERAAAAQHGADREAVATLPRRIRAVEQQLGRIVEEMAGVSAPSQKEREGRPWKAFLYDQRINKLEFRGRLMARALRYDKEALRQAVEDVWCLRAGSQKVEGGDTALGEPYIEVGR